MTMRVAKNQSVRRKRQNSASRSRKPILRASITHVLPSVSPSRPSRAIRRLTRCLSARSIGRLLQSPFELRIDQATASHPQAVALLFVVNQKCQRVVIDQYVLLVLAHERDAHGGRISRALGEKVSRNTQQGVIQARRRQLARLGIA